MTLNELELEPLKEYTIRLTKDDELVFEIPGYYPGGALVRRLLYDGGEDAVLVRNKYQCILCDHVHREVRQRLDHCKEITVVETDTMRRYKAVVSHGGIGADTGKAGKLHDYSYKYHPFPLRNGTFETGEAECSCCGKKKNIFMKAKGVAKALPEFVMCPECIADAGNLKKGIDIWPGISDRLLTSPNFYEVMGVCPPFKHNGRLSGTWGLHCGKMAVYLGRIYAEDLVIPLWSEIESTWTNEMNPFREEDPGAFFKRIDREEVSAYLFRCVECGKHLCICIKNPGAQGAEGDMLWPLRKTEKN
jgi:uncharacterized protein CbrC (UPF0167 family)